MLTQRGNEGVRYMLPVPAGIARLMKKCGNKKTFLHFRPAHQRDISYNHFPV